MSNHLSCSLAYFATFKHSSLSSSICNSSYSVCPSPISNSSLASMRLAAVLSTSFIGNNLLYCPDNIFSLCLFENIPDIAGSSPNGPKESSNTSSIPSGPKSYIASKSSRGRTSISSNVIPSLHPIAPMSRGSNSVLSASLFLNP